MQRFPCPFCGLRDETEFHFVTEAGKPRPEPSADVSDAALEEYLYLSEAPSGWAREIWLHLPCQTFCTLVRNTETREVATDQVEAGAQT